MTLEEAETITGGFSKTSKMPCLSFSTPAKDCLRGAKLALVEGSVCSKCYAKRGNFPFPVVQAKLRRNQEGIRHPNWVEATVFLLRAQEHSGFFRWFASGDLQSLEHLQKICEVARQTPRIRHWLPTHEVGILGAFTRAGLKYPPNLLVRLSGDMLERAPSSSLLRRLGVLGSSVSRTDFNCPSSLQDNACWDCRKCWFRSTPIVTYKLH